MQQVGGRRAPNTAFVPPTTYVCQSASYRTAKAANQRPSATTTAKCRVISYCGRTMIQFVTRHGLANECTPIPRASSHFGIVRQNTLDPGRDTEPPCRTPTCINGDVLREPFTQPLHQRIVLLWDSRSGRHIDQHVGDARSFSATEAIRTSSPSSNWPRTKPTRFTPPPAVVFVGPLLTEQAPLSVLAAGACRICHTSRQQAALCQGCRRMRLIACPLR